MIRFSKFLPLLVLVAVFSNAASAQDPLMGKWNIVAETQEGDKESVWEFTPSGGGDTISGKSTDNDTGDVAELKDVKIEGEDVTFNIPIEVQDTDVELSVKVKLSGETLKGAWAATDPYGNQLATGGLAGTKVALKKTVAKGKTMAIKRSPFTGQWDSVSSLSDGTKSKAVVTLSLNGEKRSGNIVGSKGKTEFNRIDVAGKTILMAYARNVSGVDRDIEIEVQLQDDGSLQGEWTVMQDGKEAASGDWSATRKITTEVLFDGKSMDSFRGYKQEAIGKGWTVDDGTLRFDGSGGDIITKKEYGSFELTFDWKVSEGGNSGVMYRVQQGDGAPYLSGVEYQILDNKKHADGKNRLTSAGAIYALYEPGDKMPKAAGQWNETKIMVKGDDVQHWLNGDMVAKAEIGSDEWNEKVAASKFATWEKFGKSKRGHIAFQAHGDEVWYRNIKIKALD